MTFPPYPKMSEFQHQIHLFQWCLRQGSPADLIFSIGNQGSISAVKGQRDKMAGLRAGVPDMCLPVARGGYHSLYIELKKIGGRPSAAQLSWIEILTNLRHRAVVCEGWLEAKSAIEDYLNL